MGEDNELANNILISFPSYERGGAERSLLNYIATLSTEFKIIVVTTNNFPLTENDQLKIVKIRNRGRRLYNAFFHLRALFQQACANQDLIFISFQAHVVTVPVLFFAKLVTRGRKQIVMRESNDVKLYSENINSWFSRFLFRRCIKAIPAALCDKIIVNSKGSLDSFRHTIGFEEKLEVLYNPAFNNAARPLSKDNLARELSFPRTYALGFIGRFESQKQPLDFVRIADEVLRHKPQSRALIIGGGPLQEDVDIAVAESKCRDRIDFLPFQKDVSKFLRQVSVLVCTSKYEGLPNILLEALYHGCKIVSYDCPSGPKEILRNGDFGTLVKVDDIESAVKAVLNCDEKDSSPEIGMLYNHLSLFSDQKFLLDFKNIRNC